MTTEPTPTHNASHQSASTSLDLTLTGRAVRPAIAAITMLAMALVLVAWSDQPLTAALLVPVVAVYGALSAVDAAEQRLPNALTLPLAGASAAVVLLAGALRGTPWAGLAAIGVGLGMAVLLFLLRFGMGDVKMALTVGTIAGWFGYGAVLTTVVAMAFSGSVVAVALLLLFRRRNVTFSYGPFLAIGSVVGMLAEGGLLPSLVS